MMHKTTARKPGSGATQLYLRISESFLLLIFLLCFEIASVPTSLLMELRLDWLLCAAWMAGTSPILMFSLPFSRLYFFYQLLLGFAKRGKIMQSSSSSHGFTIPQRLFLHFYWLGVVWTTFLLVLIWHYAYRMAPLGSDLLDYTTSASHLTGGAHIFSLHKSHSFTSEQRYKVWSSVFLLLLMETHVLRRLYETLYVFKYSPSARMHILGYLTGIFFYTAAPLSLCHFCALEAVNFAVDQVGGLDVQSQTRSSLINFNFPAFVKPIAKVGWCQWAGAAIFAWGWIHQCRCHAILGSLREHKGQSDEYVIPHGDWFEIVSSPHYLAEMVIYAGLVVASGGTDLTIWLLLLFVVANLAFAAAESHRWYLRKFEDYPRKRSAIIPFIY